MALVKLVTTVAVFINNKHHTEKISYKAGGGRQIHAAWNIET
jgi:hypothetical protein